MKLLGAVMLFFVCAKIGFHLANFFVRRPRELRQMRGALSILETEISFGATPLQQACQLVGSRESGPVGRFFIRVSEHLQRADGTSAFDCWQAALGEGKAELAMREQDRQILLRLGKKLGLSDTDDQIHHLRLAQITLETEESRAEIERGKYERLCRSMGVLIGALLVILML